MSIGVNTVSHTTTSADIRLLSYSVMKLLIYDVRYNGSNAKLCHLLQSFAEFISSLCNLEYLKIFLYVNGKRELGEPQ